MDAVRAAVEHCKSLASNKDPDVKAAIDQVSSTVFLLASSSLSRNTIMKQAGLLRKCLQPLFSVHLPTTLNYANAVLKYIHIERIVPALRRGVADPDKHWGSLVSSLISGILDYLEQHRTKKTRETVASAMHQTLCALYFGEMSGLLATYDGKLLADVYLLLRETIEIPGADAAQLRDKHIGSRRLGQTIVEIKSYLALESILDLLGRLIPPLKSGKERRTKFLKEVFDATLFKGSQHILQALGTISRDWTAMVTKIIHILAETDIGFPQPFEVSLFEVQSVPMTLVDPLFVDRSCFLANLDRDGSTDSLVIPFNTIRSITMGASRTNEMKVSMTVNMPPIMGSSPMLLPQQDVYLVSYNIQKARVDNFGKTARDRHLSVENIVHKKLSKAPSELLPDIVKASEDGTEWRAKAEKLTNMAKHGAPDSMGRDVKVDTSSPRLDREPSPFFGDRDQEILDIPSDELPKAVFLDRDGNFSIHPPQKTITKVLTDDVEDQKNVAIALPPPARTKQDLPSQEEVVSQPKPRHGHSRLRTVILSDDDDDLVKSKAVKEGVTTKRKYGEKDKSKIPQEPAGEMEMVRDIQRDIQTSPRKDPPTRYRAARSKNRATVTDPLADVVKKRPADDIDAEGLPPAKRARQTGETPQSPGIVPKADAAKHTQRHSSDSAPMEISNPFDYDEVPKPRPEPTQPRARAMKGKDGKRTVKPRPVSIKKNIKRGGENQTIAIVQDGEEGDADKTLVEQIEPKQSEALGPRSFRASTVQASTKSKSTTFHKETAHSRKSRKAPWEMEGFVPVKQEIVEDEILSYPAIDSPAEVERPTSDLISIARHPDTPAVDNVNNLPGDEMCNKNEDPLKGGTASSHRLSTPPPPPEPKPERVFIDLTNSPDVKAEKKPKKIPRKSPSMEHKRTTLEEVTTDRFVLGAPVDRGRQNFMKKIERFPSPPPVVQETDTIQSTHAPVNVHNIKIEKFPTPPQTFRMQPGKQDGDPKPPLRRGAARRFLDDVESGKQMKNHVELAKTPEQDFQERMQPGGSQIEDDPDMKINAILDEINEVVRQRVKSRFTNISSDLRRTRKALIQEVVDKLRDMHHEGIRHYNELVDLHEAYAEDSLDLMNELEGFKDITARLAQNYRDMVKDIRRNSLCKIFPKTLVPGLKDLGTLVPKIKVTF